MTSAALKTAQDSAVPVDSNIAGNDGANFFTQRSNNISAPTAKALAFTITQQEYTARVQERMRAHAGVNDAAKKLARDLGCSLGTAKNYLEGRTTPSGIHDIRAMAVIPGYLALKAELSGLEMTLDPRHQARMAEFMRYCAGASEQLFGKGRP